MELAGNDTYFVDSTGDVVTELANEGTDTINPTVTFTAKANVENLTLSELSTQCHWQYILNNTLIGNKNNILNGSTGKGYGDRRGW